MTSSNRVYGAIEPPKVRHVVAWLEAVRLITCVALWTVLAAIWLLPNVDFPLRATLPFGLTAAICRTLAAAMFYTRGDVPAWLNGCMLSADAALLTVLLDITGGPFNPFIVVYAVYIWLGVVTSPPAWAASVGLIAVAGFAWLVVDHVQAEQLEHHRLNDFPTHLFTMWFTGAAVTELVAHYVMRARQLLAQRQELLDDARERAARSERLAALTTLAAGAAHELSTPLATIAVASRELERSAARLPQTIDAVSGIRIDARLIRTEVDRCTVILDGMSGRAGDHLPLGRESLSAREITELACSRQAEEQRGRLRIDIAPNVTATHSKPAELVQALSSLLKNSFDASSAPDEVAIRVTQHGSMSRFEVQDRGHGLTEAARSRAGEPFFTTKEPGSGLGLGLFLARTIAEQAGGSLQLESDEGTTAILEIPAAGSREGES